MYNYAVVKRRRSFVKDSGYHYEKYKIMTFQVPVITGDYVDEMLVVAINHSEVETQLIVNDKYTIDSKV